MGVLIQLFASFGARRLRRAETIHAAGDTLAAELVDLLVIDAAGRLTEHLDVVRDLRPERESP